MSLRKQGALFVGLLLLVLAPARLRAGPPDEAAVRRAFGERLDELQAALDSGAALGVASALDLEGLIDHVESWDLARVETRPHRLLAGIVLTRLLETRLGSHLGALWGEEEREVESVALAADGGSAVVCVRHETFLSDALLLRWWLRRVDGEWGITDCENISDGTRASFDLALEMIGPHPSREAWQGVRDGYSRAARDLDFDAEAPLRFLGELPAGTPPRLELQRLFALARLRDENREAAEAAEAARRALAIDPEQPGLRLLLARQLVAMEQFEGTLAHVEAFESAFGPNPESSAVRAYCHRAAGDVQLALAAAREGVEATNAGIECIALLGALLPEGKKDELVTAFRSLDEPAAWFDALASRLASDDHAALAHLIEAQRSLAPDDPDIDYYTATILLERGDAARAAEVISEVLPEVIAAERWDVQYYVDLYLDAMHGAGRSLEAYERAPDPEAAFSTLGRAAWDDDDWPTLARLADAHLAVHGDCGPGLFWRAEAYRFSEEPAMGHSFYRRSLEQVHPDSRSFVLSSWILLYLREGRGLDAWAELEPQPEVFPQLARHYVEISDDAELEELVDLHAEKYPDDAAAELFRAEIAWMRGDVARSTALLVKHRGAIDASDLYWHFLGRLVRGLIRTDRADRALAVARGDGAGEGFDPWPVLLLLAHAARGDTDAATEILSGFTPEERAYHMTEDPDLPSLLESEAMAPVRAAFAADIDTDAAIDSDSGSDSDTESDTDTGVEP